MGEPHVQHRWREWRVVKQVWQKKRRGRRGGGGGGFEEEEEGFRAGEVEGGGKGKIRGGLR